MNCLLCDKKLILELAKTPGIQKCTVCGVHYEVYQKIEDSTGEVHYFYWTYPRLVNPNELEELKLKWEKTREKIKDP